MRTFISKKEKLIGFAVAFYAAAMYMALWLPFIHNKAAKSIDPLALALEGVAIVVVFAITLLVGRRIWIGLAGLAITFGPLSKYVILAMPAVIYAGIVGFRYMWQPRGTTAKKPMMGDKTKSANATSSKGTVSPSLRYTEPKPQKKRPPTTPGTSFGSLGRLGPRSQVPKDENNS